MNRINFDNEVQVNFQKSRRSYSSNPTREDRSHGKRVSRKCFGCDEHWPHVEGKTSCPAYGKTFRKCMKLHHFQKVCRSKLPANILDASSGKSDDTMVLNVMYGQ